MPLSVDPYRQRIMIDFHMLIDTDLGSALYLQKNAKNKKFFYEHMKNVNIFYLQYMALTRKEENPIEYMFLPEYRGHADSIYGELLFSKWDRVLDHSPTTDILKVVFSSYKNAGYKITINCRNEEEARRIKLVTKDWHSLIDIKDVSSYFSIYLHDLISVDRNKYDIRGKSVYLYNYSRNHPNNEMYDGNNELPKEALKWRNTTVFKFISPYSKFTLPEG